MNYRIDEKWCKEVYKKYIRVEDRVAVLAFGFRDAEITAPEEWDSYYSHESGKYYSGICNSYKAFGIPEEQITIIDFFRHTPKEIMDTIKKYIKQ